jgi:hypothetical protein
MVLAAYAVGSTHQSVLGPRGGLWPVLLMCNPLNGLCSSSGDIYADDDDEINNPYVSPSFPYPYPTKWGRYNRFFIML